MRKETRLAIGTEGCILITKVYACIGYGFNGSCPYPFRISLRSTIVRSTSFETGGIRIWRTHATTHYSPPC